LIQGGDIVFDDYVITDAINKAPPIPGAGLCHVQIFTYSQEADQFGDTATRTIARKEAGIATFA